MRNILYILVLMLAACGEPTALAPIDNPAEDTTVFARTTTFERDQVKRDATQNTTAKRDPDRYIYDWEVDDAHFTEKAPRVNVQPINTDADSVTALISYEVTASNRPPIFDKGCLEAEDPLTCSNGALKSFVKTIIDGYEDEVLQLSRDYDMVTFIVDKKGKVLGDIFIAPQEKSCKKCNQAAIRVVSSMDKWIPALKDSKPVSVRVQMPVRYR